MKLETGHRWAPLICFLLGLACVWASRCEGSDFKVIDVQELAIDYKQYLPGGHYPYITDNGMPDRMLDKGLDLIVNMTVVKYFYWDNRIVSLTDADTGSGRGQFRLVGWNFRFGLQVADAIQFGYYHFSQHLLDATLPWHFPVEDAVELRFIILRAPEPRRGVIP